ncbi:class I SAM-dependent RNA methyltransferase [Glutamicibacter sp.]|jgi:SAM-dependent methyltransferases related to tRNA (uracil-5-)-methyltransferase|uniref:class I SAM-dependent RNA methyltransferase n=1 Tax=Glutamicibacter sp. TaxID=1931995 RepID=UPI002B4A8060|nr:class I SAM-dependent RNA methyltransferase [Glutamicibacter sp.]HJX78160.1 class I SAM-dependent RNA methyltransferase [Glutamicibacter sp.]
MNAAETLELRLGSIAHGGHTVARHEGRVIFVRHGIPGELVNVVLTDAGETAKFWRADVVEVLEASEHRVPHVWDQADALTHRDPVGGAEFGHISLDYQRVLKAQVAAEQLTRLGGLKAEDYNFPEVQAVPGNPDGLGWRTRMSYSVTENGRLAMSGFRSNELTEITQMPLAHPGIEAIGLYTVDFSGIDRVEAAVSSQDDSTVLVLLSEVSPGAALRVAKQLPEGVNLAVFSQVGGSAADGKGELEVIAGNGWLTEQVLGNSFRITGEGFWQVHRSAATLLTERVMDLTAPDSGEVIADLYAGAGLFSLPLAEAVGPQGRVFSIEGAPGTHSDAKKNLAQTPQVTVTRGRVERLMRQLAREAQLDAVVLDPPRTGLDKQSAAELAASGVPRICYVSCDPAAFARDTARLMARGYELDHMEIHDLYPHTHHMESIGLFVRR